MEEKIERGSTSSVGPASQFMTSQKAVDLDEYEPEVLSRFEEWKLLSPHGQWQMVKQGLDNCERQLGPYRLNCIILLDLARSRSCRV